LSGNLYIPGFSDIDFIPCFDIVTDKNMSNIDLKNQKLINALVYKVVKK
jgi:hypothetical protein